MQVADVILNNVTAPDWVFWVILLMLAIGMVIVVVFSWVFELTPEGLKRETEVDRSHSITSNTGKKLDRLITGVLVLALAYFVFDKFVLSGQRQDAAVEAALEQAGAESELAAEAPEIADAFAADKSIAVLPFADMSPDGGLIAFRGYRTVWMWDRLPGESVADALAREPCEAPSPEERQGEAITIDDSWSYFTVSEGSNPDIYFVQARR